MICRHIKFIFFLLSALIAANTLLSSEPIQIEGTVTASLRDNSYLIRLNDMSEVIFISQESLQVNQDISIKSVITQYNHDISKPAYKPYTPDLRTGMLIMNILYAILILVYILNIVLLIRIPKKIENGQPYYLRIVSGPDSGKIFKISDRYVFSIGRDLSNDIVINDKTVSRKQADIWINPKTGDLLYKNSPKTTNPIYLNGKEISKKPYRITEEDIISIGLTNLMLIRTEDNEKN